MKQGIYQGMGRIPGARMYYQFGRFIYKNDIVILVDNVERYGFGQVFIDGLEAHVQVDNIADVNRIALPGFMPVHGHHARLDPGLDTRA